MIGGMPGLQPFDVDAITLDVLRRRRSAKWRAFEPDVLPAWIAEMDFPLAEPIARELHRAVDDSDTGYLAYDELPTVLAEFAEARWAWSIPTSRILVIPDVITGIAETLGQLTGPGEGIVINPPVYPPFFSIIRDVAHREVVEVPMLRAEDGRYSWDLEGLERAFARPDVTAYLLCHPHNPTGVVATREVLARIAELAAAHGVVVISDEIHAPLVLPGAEHVPYLTVAGDDARAVALVSASKAWNLPGLKCAQLVGTATTEASVVRKVPLEVIYATGHFGVLAAQAAYRDGGPWLAQVIDVLDGNRSLLAELLAERVPGVGYVPPQASYLAWLDMRACGLGADPAVALRERGRVALNSGPTFGREGSGFARVNIATSPAILDEIVRRIAAVVQ